MNIFNSVNLYVKISTNEIEVTNLSTCETIIKKAQDPFSTNRIVVGSFFKINSLMKEILQELKIPSTFWTTRRMLIQQTEKMDDGLAEIEKRALRDIGELSGANIVIILDHPNRISNQEAMVQLLNNK